MNEYIWSLDISTSNVGFALWSIDGKLVDLKHLVLNVDKKTPPEDRDIIKAEIFQEYITEYRQVIENEYKGVVRHIFVEEPLSNTPVNINTTALLLGFNGMARYILYQCFGIIPVKISVYTARKIFCSEFVMLKNGKETLSFPKGWGSAEKKHYIWEKVAKLEPNIEWFVKKNGKLCETNYDMSDAYVVGAVGLKLLGVDIK